MTKRRVFLIVLDGFGIGELPDADRYGDKGSNTLKNMSYAVGGIKLPAMEKLGLGHLGDFKDIPADPSPTGVFGKMKEVSNGKDSTTGHWEIAGLISEDGFPTYPDGFPDDLVKKFEQRIGRGTLWNKTASGTEIIERLGSEHVKTGKPIVYTSADSVFQVAAHEDVIPLQSLYDICKTARDLLVAPHNVVRVIARPFTGSNGHYVRTLNRKDFSLKPHGPTVLDIIKESGKDVWGVGKIDDLFVMQGITKTFHTTNNADSLKEVHRLQKEEFNGLVFANLIDFDMVYGHRNDSRGYADALISFDEHLQQITRNLKVHDMLFISSDHGNDPTTPSTDHSREYVPVLGYSPLFRRGYNLGVRTSFADLGQTIAEALKVDASTLAGQGFYGEIINSGQ